MLQVVASVKTADQAIKTASDTDITGLSVSITPSSTASKVLVFGMLNGNMSQTASVQSFRLALVDASNVVLYTMWDGVLGPTTREMTNIPFSYLHSPASTSSLTYKLRSTRDTSVEGVYVNTYSSVAITSSIIAIEIGA